MLKPIVIEKFSYLKDHFNDLSESITEEKFLELQSQFDDLSDMTYEEFVAYEQEREAYEVEVEKERNAHNIHNLAVEIYKTLNENGAELGNMSIFIIEKVIEDVCQV